MIPVEENESLNFYIPNILGSEKIAMERIASVAKRREFSDDQVEDLKTAVSEACLNAIEHGNKMEPGRKVRITLAADGPKLQVSVMDEGKGSGTKPGDQINPPRIEEKIKGKKKFRGWGIFLIKSLVNEVKFESTPDGRNIVKMTIHKKI